MAFLENVGVFVCCKHTKCLKFRNHFLKDENLSCVDFMNNTNITRYDLENNNSLMRRYKMTTKKGSWILQKKIALL